MLLCLAVLCKSAHLLHSHGWFDGPFDGNKLDDMNAHIADATGQVLLKAFTTLTPLPPYSDLPIVLQGHGGYDGPTRVPGGGRHGGMAGRGGRGGAPPGMAPDRWQQQGPLPGESHA